MNTRSSSDKSEVNNLYKVAIENRGKSKHDIYTIHTSTPQSSNSTHTQIDLSLDDSETEKDLFRTLTNTLVSDTSGDITIQPAKETEYIPNSLKNKTMANPNPFATLKYAVEAVPFFDGKNIPLTYFIEGCEEAKSMLPVEAESQFTKIIRTRIVGEARRTIQDQNFDSVAQLTKYLEQVYGPLKNIYQLQGELGSIYQRNEEDVVTYANRVKVLGKQILKAHKDSGSFLPNQDIKPSLEKDMSKCFIRGLKPEIEQRIARNLNVQETVADALRIERELYSMTDLRQGLSNAAGKTPDTNNQHETCQICYKEGHSASNCKKITNLGTEILICQICKKRGHSADKCRFRDPRVQRSVNVIQENNITCQLCSKSGHNAKFCKTSSNINNNNQNKSAIICQWCDKPGHSANNC